MKTKNLKKISERKYRKYKALPVHTYQSFPQTELGEVTRPFTIAVIVILTITALSLLLFFSREVFVGKAFTGLQGTAGLESPTASLFENNAFSLDVKANIGAGKTVALSFNLPLPSGISCLQISGIESLLGWNNLNGAAIERSECVNDEIRFEYATYDAVLAKSETFDVARINFNGLPAGVYDFQFSSFDIINLDDPRQSNPMHDLIGDGLGLSLTLAVPAPNDADSDGVENLNDLCPNTPTGASVDADGCSAAQIDADGDGVLDSIDLCPDTPSGEQADADGCSSSQADQDGDGVPDVNDNCPATPAGAQVDVDGCSVIGVAVADSDNDGIVDINDICLDTPAGENVDADGCSASQLLVPEETISGVGGGRRCIANVTCSTFSYCNATLQQSRTCIDSNNCVPSRMEVVSCLQCQESWICSEWGDCLAGQQFRTCLDEHSCGTSLQEPLTQKSCQQIVVPGPQPREIFPGLQIPPPLPQVQKQLVKLPVVPFWKKYLAYIIALVVLAVAGAIAGALYYKKHHRLAYNFDELKEWIQKEEAMGTSQDDIKEILANQTGWTSEEVDNAFAELHKK